MATKNKKKTKEPSQKELNNNLINRKALEKIIEHNRDYLKLDLTLPLGNTALKHVHTNQWLWTTVPEEFALANWNLIAKHLNAGVGRYEGVVTNKWYVESCDISVEVGGKAEMKLGLNAFASNHSKYYDDYKSIKDAYTNATTKSNDKTGAAKKTSNAVSNGNNTTVKNGWWGQWVTDLVKKTVGNETDTLKKCKMMHELFRWHCVWTEYNNMQKTGGSVKNLEKCWNDARFNCGDGAN